MLYFLLPFAVIFSLETNQNTNQFQGAWKSETGVMIVSGNYFSYCEYEAEAFLFTYGGSFEANNKQFVSTFEYHSKDSMKVGPQQSLPLKIKGDAMTLGETKFARLDDGTPGELSGTWLFSNRERNGEMGTPRLPNDPRKTMKILSGTRFQWIAYNVETKQFMGTGGGTYTTVDGKYTENIDFFSRDQSRVGASLEFDFERSENEWHHQGTSSKGDPMYEIWMLRE